MAQENQQQDRPDKELVLIYEQVRIRLSIYRVALEKQQPDIIYRLYLVILKQYSFFNSFTGTDDVPLVIKLDAVLGNLKFANNGEKDPIYGMAIPKEMMSNEIKVFADYLNYLAKSMGTQPSKGRGKGILTKKGIEVVVQKKLETTKIPKKKRTKTVIKETSQSEVLAATTDEETLDHSTMKLKGVENVSSTAQFLKDMKKARKASKDDYTIQQRPKGPGEGSSIVIDTLDEPSYSSSSSHSGSDNDKAFLQTDDEELKEQSDDEKTKTANSDAKA
ncbi:hypothetical protein Tco_0787521 [Tanacetum coccineum]